MLWPFNLRPAIIRLTPLEVYVADPRLGSPPDEAVAQTLGPGHMNDPGEVYGVVFLSLKLRIWFVSVAPPVAPVNPTYAAPEASPIFGKLSGTARMRR